MRDEYVPLRYTQMSTASTFPLISRLIMSKQPFFNASLANLEMPSVIEGSLNLESSPNPLMLRSTSLLQYLILLVYTSYLGIALSSCLRFFWRFLSSELE